MKKITLLCFLAMGSSAATWAKVGDKITNLNQLSNNKYYTIQPQDNGRGTWTTNDADPGFLYSTGKIGLAVDGTKPSQQFAFIKSASGKYYAYNIGSQKFLSYTPDKGQTVALVSNLLSTDVEAAFIASTDATHKDQYPWVLALNGHHVGISNNYTTGIITHYSSTADGGNCISITEAGDFNPTDALAQIKAYEEMYSEENVALLNDGKKFLSTPEGYVGSCDPALLQALKDVCGDNGVLDITEAISTEGKAAIEALRAASEVNISAQKVYKLQNMNAANGFLVSKDEEGMSRIFSSAKEEITPSANSEYWQILTTADGYAFLYNVGTKSYAQYNASKNQWELSATPAITKVIRNTDKNMATFVIQDQAFTGKFQYLHINNSQGETGVVGWETASDATNFYLIEQSDIQADELDGNALAKVYEKKQAESILSKYIEGKENYIGNYQISDINDLKALIGNDNATAQEIKEQTEKVINNRNLPDAGKYYYIQSTMAFNDGQTKVIYENPDGSNIAWNTVAQGPAELWQFEDAGNGNYYIKSANTGKYMKLEVGNPTATMNVEKTSAFKFEERENMITLGIANYPASGDKTTLTLQTDNAWGSVANADNTSGNYAGSYNDYAEKYANKWNIIEANSVKVSIEASEYATLWLPYAVDLSGSGVEAYTISSIENSTATLKKIEGNIIPANSAVILKGAAGSYNFAIVADNAQESISSELQGTNIATAVATDVNAYILGDVEGQVGFYQMDKTDRTLGANKAYLVLPKEAQAIRSIIIGGPTTGIEDTVAEGAEVEEYYDLQGRRVMNPVKGIYVTKSGKKVVFNK